MLKIRLPLIPMILTAGLLFGCESPEQVGLTDEDKAAVRSTSETWLAAVTDGRWEDAAATYTEDAILWFNGNKIDGRDAILEFMRQLPPMTGMELVVDEVYGSGNVAVVSGHSTQEVDGETVLSGYYLDTRLRQPDGTWLYHRDKVSFYLAPPYASGTPDDDPQSP